MPYFSETDDQAAIQFTPTWSSDGTQPALGNGTISGTYLKIGKIIYFESVITMGSTSTYGTGVYRLSLPSAYPRLSFLVGNAWAYDNGVAEYMGQLSAATNTEYTIRWQDGATMNYWTSGNPHTWGSTDTATAIGFYVTT